jgi:Mg2+-importing ATPase
MPITTRGSIDAYWACDAQELLELLSTSPSGLSVREAERRQETAPRPIGTAHNSSLRLLFRQFRNPIILLLLIAALLSMSFGDITDGAVIVTIVLASGALSFIQERGAVATLEELTSSIAVHAGVLRDGVERQVLVGDVIPGDVVVLRAGDMIPGDCRLLSANRLQVNEAPLTGENYPRHKEPGVVDATTEPTQRSNCLFLGTHVASGEGRAVVVHTGVDTDFGAVTKHVTRQHLPTAFERGVTDFGYFLMRVTGVLVVALFVFNTVLSRSITESLLFSLALAVGLTPQMLPAIVTLSLSRGAATMARKRVIVRRLDAIEDIGGLDVLCTDKTGTLTVGSVGLHSAVDIRGLASDDVLASAWWNAFLATGYKNPIDDAIVATPAPAATPRLIGEIPFDFNRRRQSVVVESAEGPLLVAKGAVEPLLSVCTAARLDRFGTVPLVDAETAIDATFRLLSSEGLRVIGVAVRHLDVIGDIGDITVAMEGNLTFIGFLCFADPPKPGTSENLVRLRSLDVRVVVITGDNRLSATETARRVGINANNVLTGADLASMTPDVLAAACENTDIFCEVDPIQKEMVVRTLSASGHTVGFLGDGINDTPALHASDVGISVENAVDVAKHTADLILLDKDLAVLATGIEQGRRIFTNTLKYVQVTTSANFGNMLSLALATVFLPFLPLLPLQILLLNFMSDIPGLTIATDNVDPEQIEKHQRWDISRVRRFMIVFGLASTMFDLLTFTILRLVLDVSEVELRSGWFVLSTFTELAAMLILRTRRVFFRSLPGRALLITSISVGVATAALPYTPLASPLGLAGLSGVVFGTLLVLVIGYVVLTETLKHVPWSRMQSR